MVQLGNTERRPKKNSLCTSGKERLMYVLKRTHHMYVLRRTCFIRICERYKKYLSIFPNAYIYSLHRMSCIHLFFAQNVHQESWYLTSCFNQLQRYFVCHFEPSFDIIITIIITIMTLSMAEYHRMGGSNTKNAKLWDLVVYIHSKQGFWCIKIPDNIV